MARRARARRTKGNKDCERWTAEEARQLLAAWERSGLTMAAFCRTRGIRARRLYWWRSRLAAWSQGEEDGPTEQPAADPVHQLVEAVVVPSAPAPPDVAVALHLSSGDRIEVVSAQHVEADWLVCLAQGLRASAEGGAR